MHGFRMVVTGGLPVLLALSLACGDHGDGGSEGKPGDGDSESPSDGDAGPFAAFDCGTADTASCDYLACLQKASMTKTLDGVDCAAEGEAYCEALEACYTTYVGCFVANCAPGGSTDGIDLELLTACATAITPCVSEIPRDTETAS